MNLVESFAVLAFARIRSTPSSVSMTSPPFACANHENSYSPPIFSIPRVWHILLNAKEIDTAAGGASSIDNISALMALTGG
jgi:hypothetical protein